MSRLLYAIPLLALASCNSHETDKTDQPQRISLDAAEHVAETPLPSPDTEGARWDVSDNGQAIHFGQPGQKPMLTLACHLRETPPAIAIIRHVAARPGEKALFPVIGNGMISRFKVDATLEDGEWRWEGSLPASDPQLDVFTGRRELEATLPGGGSLQIDGSRIPGEFVNWCRAGGRVQRVEAQEKVEAALEKRKAD